MIDVKFPDGSVRSVPGQLCALMSETGKLSDRRFRQVPINCDPMWRFIPDSNGWIAVPRHGSDVAIFTPKSSCWWESIAQMNAGADLDSEAEAA